MAKYCLDGSPLRYIERDGFTSPAMVIEKKITDLTGVFDELENRCKAYDLAMTIHNIDGALGASFFNNYDHRTVLRVRELLLKDYERAQQLVEAKYEDNIVAGLDFIDEGLKDENKE